MKPKSKNLALPIALASFAAANAHAAIVVDPTFSDILVAPTVSNTDLAQTAVANPTTDIVAVSSDALGASTRRLELFNGAVGDGSQNTSANSQVRIQTGDTLSIAFDTSTNTLGYDITGITSVFNWNDRADQGYTVDIFFVGGGSATLLSGFHADQNPQNSTQHYSIATITNDVGGVLDNGTNAATGVESITFTFTNLRNPSVAAEIDIFGAATVPEPSSLALLGLGGLLAAARRRRA